MIKVSDFGKFGDREVNMYTLTDSDGSYVNIIGYGGAIQSLCVKDKEGILTDIALGYNTLEEYCNNGGYIGAIIGRYANRIKEGIFKANGKLYSLYTNDGKNHLHGGKQGFDKKIWDAEIQDDKLILKYESADMEEGYPGKLTCEVTYTFSGGELKIAYRAKCNEDCPVNLTNHCYFNLDGEGLGNVLSHEMKINASHYTATDAESIPTVMSHVQGTPFDFRTFHKIGERIGEKDIQLLQARGYDHNFALSGAGSRLAAETYSKKSGILMQTYTDMEGLQFYSGNYLDGTFCGKSKIPYAKNFGFCLETQHYPDSPNRNDFPSPILKKGQVYQYETSYIFSVKR